MREHVAMETLPGKIKDLCYQILEHKTLTRSALLMFPSVLKVPCGQSGAVLLTPGGSWSDGGGGASDPREQAFLDVSRLLLFIDHML